MIHSRIPTPEKQETQIISLESILIQEKNPTDSSSTFLRKGTNGMKN